MIASIPYDWSPCRLLGCTLGRVILIPLMLACAAPRGDPYLHHEGWSMVLSAALGLSNGYFGSVPMILAPAKVPDEQKKITGMYNSCWKIIDGLLAGTEKLYERSYPSVCPTDRLFIHHTVLTMLLASYHYEFFRSNYHWQKVCPCKSWWSGLKVKTKFAPIW